MKYTHFKGLVELFLKLLLLLLLVACGDVQLGSPNDDDEDDML